MIATNDNQTIEQFTAREEPTPSVAEFEHGNHAAVHYVLQQDGPKFVLARIGRFKAHPDLPRTFQAFPVAGSPHPLCPAHTYVPPAAQRPPLRSVKTRPDYLRVVA